MKRCPSLRLLLYFTLGLTCAGVLLVLLRFLVVPIIVFLVPSLDSLLYDLGAYGPFRSQSFRSFNLTAPQISVVKWEESCNQGLTFLDLNGASVNHHGTLILDSDGHMVWTSDAYGVTINSRIQEYKGEKYLTFWAGEKAATSGKGNYYMLDSSYRLAFTVAAVGDRLHGDLHEFKITFDDTALMTVYNTTNADLTAMCMWRDKDGWVIDSLFQEIDIETGALLFQWRASDYFDAADSYMTNPVGGYVESIPFDFFHINSVEKDSLGNYLISARHMHMIMYIDGDSGEVLWVLGGHANDFADLSNGAATNFKWQHDARWLSEDDGIISLFDNGVAWPHVDAPYSQGLVIQLNSTNMTATLLHSYVSLQHARSSSQGSVQLLTASGGEPHIFIGWGSSAAYSEFSTDGQLLCETHFGASAFYFWERVKSYRAFKIPRHEWIATPVDWPPAAVMQGHNIYVSWNGATEVTYWSLAGAHDDVATSVHAHSFEDIDMIEKSGFESSFDVSTLAPSYAFYRVAALDADRNIIGVSNIIAASSSRHVTPFLQATIVAGVALALFLGLWISYRRRRYSWPSLAMGWSFTGGGGSITRYQKLWQRTQ